MPEIARFYGIVIKLFFGNHPPPHFHAVYGEFVGLSNIDTLEIIEGDLPTRAQKNQLFEKTPKPGFLK